MVERSTMTAKTITLIVMLMAISDGYLQHTILWAMDRLCCWVLGMIDPLGLFILILKT
ncbi:hypothetical protein [Aeromonas tecta]|uniref:hypothetical protein n=1 Tax=Aeromonas tecta TaxID=324617 RepID=UPI0012F8FD6F|nr:hypothetical protein [Aeromonas tecta]